MSATLEWFGTATFRVRDDGRTFFFVREPPIDSSIASRTSNCQKRPLSSRLSRSHRS